MLVAHRFAENPLIHPGLDPSIGTNLNGPSLIRVPEWVPQPLGRYYLYFAHHQGQYIRLAFADDLHGPWQIHVPGTLHIDQTGCHSHIASPDVHLDDVRREIVMYFHGCVAEGQRSFRATSAEGLHFTAESAVLGDFYFRVFEHEGWHYALAKRTGAPGGGILLRSPDGREPFEVGPHLLPRMRHAALQPHAGAIRIFFSRGEDCPEQILQTEIRLDGDWRQWRVADVHEVLAPEMRYEGAELPLEPSRFGAIHTPARQLRDPAIFTEGGRTFLIYAAAGESALCLAELIEDGG
jgi:hypothetical protein